MLKFFRQIRQSLISENKFSRYFLYAIGEVLLVMVGILLALFVNNKNEDRKRTNKSIEIVQEIKGNLESNTKQFQQEIELEKSVISSIDIVLDNVRETKIYHDSLDKHFHLCGFWPTSTWETSGYESLKSQGIELIESEKLRKGIIELYELKYSEISEIVRNSEGYSYSTLIPTLSELFLFEKSTVDQLYTEYEAKPFDYGDILNSNKLQGILSFWRLMRVVGTGLRENAIKENERLIELIERELNNKN